MSAAVGVAGHAAAHPVHHVLAGAGALQRADLAAPGLPQVLGADLQGARPCQVPIHEAGLRCWPVRLTFCSFMCITNVLSSHPHCACTVSKEQ